MVEIVSQKGEYIISVFIETFISLDTKGYIISEKCDNLKISRLAYLLGLGLLKLLKGVILVHYILDNV